MTNKQILDELRIIFSTARSPGEAFDAILRLRRDDAVTFDSIVKACRANESEGGFDTVATEAKQADVLFFGKYRGRPLALVAAQNPAYLQWALENATCLNDAWRVKIEKALEEQGEPLEADDSLTGNKELD